MKREQGMEGRRKKEVALVSAIVLIAVGLRLWTLDYDLPYVFHPDEPAVIRVTLGIIKSGDLNPHFFHYPSLVFYVHALIYALYYGVGRIMGTMSSPADLADLSSIVMGTTVAPDPRIVLLSRIATVILGIGSVVLVYLIGRRLTDRWAVGAVAALFLAISPTHIYHSRIVTPDIFVTFLALSTFYFAVLIYREEKSWAYWAAGIAVGLTAGSKYNGAIIGLVIPVAHFLRAGPAGWKDGRLYLTIPLAALTFLLTTPYALLDFPAFSEALAFDAAHYSSGHTGMEGNTVRWYMDFLWSTMTIIPLLAVAQLVRGALTKSKSTVLLATFPVVYFVFISRFIVRNDRTILPILPFIFLLAAIPFVDGALAIRHIHNDTRRRVALTALVLLGIGLLALPADLSVADNFDRNKEQVKPLATDWIAANIPAGSLIAIESYAPYMDPELYVIQSFDQLIDHSPQWYVDQGFDYLILSRGVYGRYFREPERYADEVGRYEAFFNFFELAQLFSSDRAEIRIYRAGDQ